MGWHSSEAHQEQKRPGIPKETPRASPAQGVTPFPTANFWQQQIVAEESLRPSISLIDDVYADSLHDVMIAPHDNDNALEGMENGDIIFYNDARIGSVVTEHSRLGALAFRTIGGSRRFKQGDTLVLQSAQKLRASDGVPMRCVVCYVIRPRLRT
ncbi:hypothetical protein AJ87_48770 [Rhizobium yanglingense]|nr:hypothetical protein AJ87_48770 [Rhizobium yanglingense]